MARKDYQAIEGALAAARRFHAGNEAAVQGIVTAAVNLATALAADNARFDRDRFLAAVMEVK